MARKYATGTLIHCEACGEDFSATYKRCPFCGEKPGDQPTTTLPQMDEYIFEGGGVFDDGDSSPSRSSSTPARGGRRLASGIREDVPAAVNWTRLITFICSLVIIAAALVIVFTWIYPAIHINDPSTADSLPPVSMGPVSQPSAVPSQAVPPTEPVTEPPAVSQEPTVPPTQPPTTPAPSGDGVTSLTLSRSDFTLTAESPSNTYTIIATIAPAGWTGTVTWTSSDPDIATVDANGKVTNVNTADRKRSTTITCTAGGQTATCIVYCSGGVTGGGESSAPVAELKLNKFDVSIDVGETFTIKAEGAEGVTWTISDPTIATVDADGKVIGVSPGRTTITGTAPNGAVGTCIVRVRGG